MTPSRDTLLRVLLPIIGVVIVIIVARQRDMSFTRDLGLRLPSWESTLMWLVLFVALVVIEEWLSNAWGLSKPEPWSVKYHGTTKVIRVLALVLIAPISEEVVFRGMLYHLVSTTRLQDVGAILITALIFAAFHYQYSSKEVLLILADGLFFGVVRYATGSTVLTIALHMLGNSYAAYQRLFLMALLR
jgi:uncharacterized protein